MPSKIILASGSKSRLKLLKQINIIPDLIAPADIDETSLEKEKPKDMVMRLAKSKCQNISEKYPGDVIIAADTISVVGTRVLDKTYDAETERKYLNLISGRRHRLYTSLCVAVRSRNVFVQRTMLSCLKFKRFSKEEIEEYIASREWEGCSGGYAIEGLAAKYLEWISGSFSNILGLPLHELHKILSGIGVEYGNK